MKRRPAIFVLPSVLTLGNLSCGFMAISMMSEVEFASSYRFMWSGWLIVCGMIFDVLDGRVARMTGRTSDFGAHLDSLADMVTFGVAPALLSGQMVRVLVDPLHPRTAWVFSSVFALCAALRLARYGAERDREAEPIGLRQFTGLPSPAAAGVMAAMALFFVAMLDNHEINSVFQMRESIYVWLVKSMPLTALICGLLMVSRFQYLHIANTVFRSRVPFVYLVLLVFVIMIFVQAPEMTLLVLFGTFALSGPLVTSFRWARGSLQEEEREIF